MTIPFLSASHFYTPAWLALLMMNLFLSLAVALFWRRHTTTGFFRLFLLGLLVTAPLSCLIVLLHRKQEQKSERLGRRLSDPSTLEDYLLKLKLYKQTGMISKREYEAEKKRLSKAESKPPAQLRVLPTTPAVGSARFSLPRVGQEETRWKL